MPRLLYIDLFCGAGGTSTGVNSARLDGKPCAEVTIARVWTEALCAAVQSRPLCKMSQAG